MADDAVIRQGKHPQYAKTTAKARAAYRETINNSRGPMKTAREEAYNRAYRTAKIRNRAVVGFGGLAVANGGDKTRHNQSTYAARGMRNSSIGQSSGAMQRLDYGNRSSGAYA